MANSYERLLAKTRVIGRLTAVEALLDWDQETYMPPKGVGGRAEELALIAELIHDRRVDPELGELLADLSDDGGDHVQNTNVREMRRGYDRAVKVPAALVGRIAHVSAHARGTWSQARKDAHFPTFAPHLKEMLELKREVADRVGFVGERYDAMLDEYEPGALSSDVAETFQSLREPLSDLAKRLAGASSKPDTSVLNRHYPTAAQASFARKLSGAIGFDFERGRLDVTTHPFCSGTTPNDVRLTTRYLEDFFNAAIFGTLHETGHGLYEQGLDPAHMFTPAGLAVSLGIHESQSRLWENMIGRSRPFWEHFYPDCQASFPESFGDVSLDTFVRAINAVEPSMIRVEADEVTYGLHVILRFELERDMIEGKVSVDDIPEAWNTRMRDLLGITPPNDREGCLQDVHWSAGLFGYFPTYALGNLYGAQFFAAAREAIPDLDARVRRGDFGTLLEWLRTNIHRHGQRYRANDLVREVTGQPLSTAPFMTYLREKFSAVYGL